MLSAAKYSRVAKCNALQCSAVYGRVVYCSVVQCNAVHYSIVDIKLRNYWVMFHNLFVLFCATAVLAIDHGRMTGVEAARCLIDQNASICFLWSLSMGFYIKVQIFTATVLTYRTLRIQYARGVNERTELRECFAHRDIHL